ncbi:flavodoxin family protein [Candidatus Nitrosocosmicus hydrocola]|uniref:flavodoxin family protein n=1 Tax=Candidatus Nitrosocosmicus hydrocola TaxID=1826872 RepID=UPI0011E5AB1B|nr:NAD(P)H-dependent oxidoreductase [Candidatus Nitrosocosmicus hydrocola]
MAKLKAIILVGSLNNDSGTPNTLLLSQFLAKHFAEYNTVVDHYIKAGTYTNIDSDNWPSILEKLLNSDIVIFATPVWWGIQSSLIQRVIERLDELHDEIMDTGKSRVANKVAGIIVTGDSDGVEHIIGNL